MHIDVCVLVCGADLFKGYEDLVSEVVFVKTIDDENELLEGF